MNGLMSSLFMFCGVIAIIGVLMYGTTFLPATALTAWSTASAPSAAGSWATVSWIVPVVSPVIWNGLRVERG